VVTIPKEEPIVRLDLDKTGMGGIYYFELLD